MYIFRIIVVRKKKSKTSKACLLDREVNHWQSIHPLGMRKRLIVDVLLPIFLSDSINLEYKDNMKRSPCCNYKVKRCFETGKGIIRSSL